MKLRRRVPSSSVASLFVCIWLLVTLLPAVAGKPPGGWTKATKIKGSSNDLGHDAFVADDRAHVAFAGRTGDDPNAARLFYGTNDTAQASWNFETVKDLSSVTGLRPALAVAPDGTAYIVYHYRGADGVDVIEVGSNAGGTWTFEVLAGTGGADIEFARWPDIALQPDGSPAVVFTGAQQAPCTGEQDLYLTELAGGSWTPPSNVSINDTNCRQHTFPALAGGPDGLHLVYRSDDVVAGDQGIHYRNGMLSNASDETIDDSGNVLENGVDVITDSTGTPHAAYLLEHDPCCVREVRYAVRDAGTWSSEMVLEGDALPVSGDPSIAIGANGPAVAFTEDGRAFAAEDKADGWTIKNLNAESQENRDPVLASTPGARLHAVLVRAASSDSLLYLHEAPRAQAEFAVEGAEFRGGQEVDMSGDLDPATVRERVKIETQKFKNGSWRAYDIKKLRTRADGSFDYTHDPFPGGKKYRSRLLWKDTIDHLDGRTVWDGFLVERKRAH